jgi:uncharacterized protein YjbI with pentapeptide repeats
LVEVDFIEADLTQASFPKCDFKNAAFERTVLEKADFRTAVNYSFDPELNKIKKAKFLAADVVRLLEKYQIEIQ